MRPIGARRMSFPTPSVAFMPVPPAPQPSSRVRLFVEGVRHDVIEFSPAGVTVPRTALEVQGLGALRRGEPCPATLQVFGEMYGVVLRLAARTPLHVEFAFVSLAPQARRALEHYATEEAVAERLDSEAAAELPKPMALAFARLTESVLPAGRRLALADSEGVLALTVERKRKQAGEAVEAAPEAFVVPDPDTITITGRELLAYGVALLAVLSLVLMWTLG